MWIGWGPVYVVDARDVNSSQFIDELSGKIRVTLDNSVHGVPHPSQTEWKAVQAPMLEAVGVKSWNTLAKGAKSVGLEREDTLVKMEPAANYEKQGGTSLPDKTVECDLNSSELGSALMKAFEACS